MSFLNNNIDADTTIYDRALLKESTKDLAPPIIRAEETIVSK